MSSEWFSQLSVLIGSPDPAGDLALEMLAGAFVIPIVSGLKAKFGSEWDDKDKAACTAAVCVVGAILLCVGRGDFSAISIFKAFGVALVTAHRLYESVGKWLKKQVMKQGETLGDE